MLCHHNNATSMVGPKNSGNQHGLFQALRQVACRCLLCLCLTEPGGLVKLGRSLHEQAGVYYLEESRRMLSIHAERRLPPPELNARVSFRVLALWHCCLQTHITGGHTRTHARRHACTHDCATWQGLCTHAADRGMRSLAST